MRRLRVVWRGLSEHSVRAEDFLMRKGQTYIPCSNINVFSQRKSHIVCRSLIYG